MAVIAYHLIWTNYGTWLPNDPRGSGSTSVYTPKVAELGDAHLGRKKVQPRRHEVSAFYAEVDVRLRYDVLHFDSSEREVIGKSFAESILVHKYTCYACAIMPDHVHLVIRKHRDPAEVMIEKFQMESRARLVEQGRAEEGHPVWTKGGWKVFLHSPAEVRSRVRYIENNPLKEGLPAQRWPFVTKYDNWPFHKRG
ncbi:MAG TPA: transposase [Lacipirellulaceae bacterium]|nr:transposase [Lacipirellulaceae bacterium]